MKALRQLSLRCVMVFAIAARCFLGSYDAFAQPGPVAESTSVNLAKSPVDNFRELLSMAPDVRQKLLAKRSDQSRQRITEKIREYSSLSQEERDVRLQATETSWYLTQLLNAPETNRPALLATIPADKRALVESRLRLWEKLGAVTRQTLRTNHTLNLLVRAGNASAPTPASAEESRQKLKSRLDHFVKLQSEEKTKVLLRLPEAERQQMEKTLQTFEQLPPEQRDRCIQSFAKFATMNPTEQQQFLKNAQRWSQMSPAERQSWRQLVNEVLEPASNSAPVQKNGG